jgi:hypothetical protein
MENPALPLRQGDGFDSTPFFQPDLKSQVGDVVGT